MRKKRRETQRQGPIAVRELGHAWARLDCLNSSPSGCVRSPPGKTLKPGFLSHGGVRFASVIFRQDTPCNEQGQGMNRGPKRGPGQRCNYEIAYRQQWIDEAQLEKLAQPLIKNGYGQYLLRVLKEKVF